MKSRTKAAMTATAAFALAVGAVLVSAVPASATTIAIHGSQFQDTQVYYATGHTNTYAYNGMSISPYSSLDCGYYSLLFGARYTYNAGPSSGKTGTIWPGQSSAFFNSNLGNYRMPMGTFYLTVYSSPGGGCGDFTPTWYATLIYNVPN